MSFDPISAGIEFAGKVVDRIWPDATEAQKAEASKVIAEMAHDESMFKTEVDDRRSAREREATIATSDAAPTLNKVITPLLAIGVLVSTVLLFGGVVFGSGTIDPTRKDIAVFVLGQLAGICTMVIAYYFGSSSGSTQKNDFIEHMMQKRP
jgi:hypothetical protein